jgi:hypothetical protein
MESRSILRCCSKANSFEFKPMVAGPLGDKEQGGLAGYWGTFQINDIGDVTLICEARAA